MNESLIAQFINSVNLYPERQALYIDSQSYSYKTLCAMAENLAQQLPQNSGKQSLCAILCRKSITAYVAILASLMAGSVYVPLNIKQPSERITLMVKQAAVDFLIVAADCLTHAKDVLQAITKPLLVILPDTKILPNWCQELQQHIFLTVVNFKKNAKSQINYTEISKHGAYLMFTSGSSGLPKGIAVSNKNVTTYIQTILDKYNPTPDDRFSQITELTFDLSVHDIFVCWAAGACLYPMTEAIPLNIVAFIQKYKLTFWLSVPSVIIYIQQRMQHKLACFTSLRHSIFCGEQLSNRLAEFWSRVAPNATIDNFYGPTEATIAITSHRWRQNASSVFDFVPIGKPFPQHNIAIVDQNLQPVIQHTIGELCLSGSQLTQGYLENLQLTQTNFIRLPAIDNGKNIWYRTGDLVQWHTEVGLLFKGRCDDQIQIKGCRVEKQEIELALREAAGTEAVAVLPLKQLDTIVLEIVAYISKPQYVIDEIYQRCRQLLPDYLIPSAIVELASLPKNANGKTDYKQLRSFNLHGRNRFL